MIVGYSIFLFFRPQDKFDWSQIRPEVKDSVVMLQQNYLAYGPTGINFQFSKGYFTREWISSNMTVLEAKILVSYPTSAVRWLSIEHIYYNDNNYFNRLRPVLIKDSSYILIGGGGCVSSTFRVCDLVKRLSSQEILQ
ncbi:MAG: hypothetical protein COA58_03890 [Bacteroidetes bacterium]|nr:MAG: hypothetical protein COA58_03890 [Bacteroidota bacterium]